MALLIIAACSGTGKSTLVKELLVRHSRLRLSVSHTTRLSRPGEVDGVAYHFIEREFFEQKIATGDFVEWAEYAGNLYGTSRTMIEEAEAKGLDLLFEVEVQGAEALKETYPHALSCFIFPPSWMELESRLRGRMTETEASIQKRLNTSRRELDVVPQFDYFVVNDQVERAVDDLSALYRTAQLQKCNQGHLLTQFKMESVH
jgi:guanylate kinase